MENESMSAICFRTTLKGGLPHYSCIFRNTEPLVMEIKNVACYRLVTMLHLKIQKGKEDMKTSKFQQQIKGTAACMMRLMMDTKACCQ